MTLYLLPNLLGPGQDPRLFLPAGVPEAVSRIDGLIAESEGEGRRFLKLFQTKKKPHLMPIALLSKKRGDLDFLLEPLLAGETWGVVSDCGLPCLADPGANLVLRARQKKIPIHAFSGPSSITHILMLSGLSAQAFHFHGYIPKEPQARQLALQRWEKEKGISHLFIEAPYRNLHTLRACLDGLKESTYLSIGANLTLPDEWIQTLRIGEWRRENFDELSSHLAKKPVIFVFHAS